MFGIDDMYNSRDEIKAVAEMMSEAGLTKIKLKWDDCELELERGAVSAPSAVPAAPAPAAEAAPQMAGFPVKSPMVGVFYAAPSPEDEPFVKVGDSVKKGDVLCIIEAMKLMNEITAEQDGTVAEVCVEDGALVEFGQPLFILK